MKALNCPCASTHILRLVVAFEELGIPRAFILVRKHLGD